MFADIIITSLINGSTYALLAIGFSLIFGVARIVNIAHTAFYMVAAFCIFFVTHHWEFHPIVGMLIAVPLVTLLGMVTYWIFIAPIREHEAAVLIGTIALAIALQEVMLLIFTGDYRSVPPLVQGYFTIIGVKVFYQQLITFVAALVILGALRLLLMKTRLGLAIRSTAQDREVANLMGMNESPGGPVYGWYIHCAGRFHGGGDRAVDHRGAVYVAASVDYDDGGGGPGWFGQHQGEFCRGLYSGIRRSSGGFPDTHGSVSQGFGGAFHYDTGTANPAGRLIRHRV